MPPPGEAAREAEAALCRAKVREIRLDIPSTRLGGGGGGGGGARAHPSASDDSNGSTVAICGQTRQGGGGGGGSDSDDSITSPDADPAVARHRGLPQFREATRPLQQRQEGAGEVSDLEGRLAGMALRPQEQEG